MTTVKGYSLKEVAKKVGVSTATIVRWIEVKKVEISKKKNARGNYIFTEADLQKAIEKMEQEARKIRVRCPLSPSGSDVQRRTAISNPSRGWKKNWALFS